MKRSDSMSNNLLLNIQQFNPSIATLDAQQILNKSGAIVGWNYYFMDKHGSAFAGGTSQTSHIAKQIAVAECFERSLFVRFTSDPQMTAQLLLDESPSASGFAAGFNRSSTSFRSICEAVERWAWSKWIDDKFKIDELDGKPVLNELASHLASFFDRQIFLQKCIHTDFQYPFPKKVFFNVYLGFKGEGVFAGSRVAGVDDDPWEHSIIEAYRNFKNFQIHDGLLNPVASIILQRVMYFGKNLGEALRQIDAASFLEWPSPELRMHTEVETNIEGVYLFRSLCKDFYYWHLGDHKRFVY